MLTVFPFYDGDVKQMLNLLEWIHELGGCKQHDALLVADAGVDWKRCLEVKTLAAKSFKTVTMISNKTSVMGWIEGPKSLFLAGAKYAHAHRVPFLQMETDAVPLTLDWLDRIEAEYANAEHPYMGHLYKSMTPGFPETCLSGIAVYPYHVWAYQSAIEQGLNWDMTLSNFVPLITKHTKLIYHFWGSKGFPPTFRDRTLARPVNAFHLDDIPKEAVLFHRNKDGTLQALLREKLRPAKEVERAA